jgi:HD-like signal output (HDOD) protein
MQNPRPFKIIKNNVVIFHHAYIGLLLLGWNYPINLIGLLIFLDDLYEHTIDENSLLRIFFDKYISPKL